MYPSKTKTSLCGYCGKSMLDNSLGQHCRDVHGKTKLVKGQKTLSFTPFSGSKCKNSRNDSYESQVDTDGATQEHSSISENISLEKRPNEVNVTAICSSSYVTTNSSSNVSSTVDQKLDLILGKLSSLDLKFSGAVGRVRSSEPEPTESKNPCTIDPAEEQFRQCKTLSDICESFKELTYVSDEKLLTCTYCALYPHKSGSGIFEYNSQHDDQFLTSQIMSTQFRCLKRNIKRHFSREVHTDNVAKWEQTERIQPHRETRSHAIGMRIARICYDGYKSGLSNRGFESEILKAQLNGLDVGNINHSKEFYSWFRPFVANEVRHCVNKYFSSRLPQTGFLPPLNLQADKGTNCRRTRQFTSIVTVVPDTKDLLTNIYLGQPVVKLHDGPGISQSIIDELTKWGIVSSQIEGASFDGQYFHLGVPNHLADNLGLGKSFISTWDPLHRGGVIDTHIREDKNFEWLVEIQGVCKQIYSTFNWGKNYENFLQTCIDLDIDMKKLTNFQMTRFANSVRFVFINIRNDYKALRQALCEIISSKENSSNAKDRGKAEEARTVSRKINSWVFSLCLSGCADLYDIFGCLSNVCQKVDLLPFERFDKIQSVIRTISKMYMTIEHTNCHANDCKWKRYHADLISMNTHNRYMDCAIDHVSMGISRQTRLQASESQIAITDGINLVKERLSTLSWRLQHDFSNELFDAEAKQIIEHCRTICDIKALLSKIHRRGAVSVGVQEGQNFFRPCQQLQTRVICSQRIIFQNVPADSVILGLGILVLDGRLL